LWVCVVALSLFVALWDLVPLGSLPLSIPWFVSPLQIFDFMIHFMRHIVMSYMLFMDPSWSFVVRVSHQPCCAALANSLSLPIGLESLD